MSASNYTSYNKDRIQSLVKKVKDLKGECENITTDQSIVSFEMQGSFVRCSKERQAFMLKTEEFRRRLREGESIEDIMVEALAVVREATKRTLGMFHYDVQIEAAIAMLGRSYFSDDEDGKLKEYHEKIIAQMRTGEGKTLVQILIAYLNVLVATQDEDPSKWSSVHIMTSNDALAKRDATENGKVFFLLGLSSDFVPSRRSVKGASLAEKSIYKVRKKQAYRADIVYATASTIAFDYLDDNTIVDVKDRNITRPFGYAIVDEADDILIDQATSPLLISGRAIGLDQSYEDELKQSDISKRKYYKWATEFLYGKRGVRAKGLRYKVFDQFKKEPFTTIQETFEENYNEDYGFVKDGDEVLLSQTIIDEISKVSLDEEDCNLRVIALQNCIKARHAFLVDREYKVQVDKDGKTAQIILIDQNVGRKKYSSKYVDGMQEAIEAKEQYMEQDSPTAKKRYDIVYSENKSIRAMCTYPDFLSIYSLGVCGMTGTSDEEEFKNLYGFETYEVPTRKKNIRIDEEDVLYPTAASKYKAIVEDVIRCRKIGRPVLIGTSSLAESVKISSLLREHGITHNLLNADNEEIENEIIATAGLFGSVTVATNMAGRGTDIKLGPGVKELGGLYVIGTSKNKSSRIDYQLRGRAARQGDPGTTKYYSSLEDDLVRENFKGDILKALIESQDQDKPITSRRCIKAANRCQEQKESIDKQSRIVTEKFNKSFREHRKIMYSNRREVLESSPAEFIEMIKRVMSKYVKILVDNYSKEEISSFISKFADVDECYNSNSETFKKNLLNNIWDNYKKTFPTFDDKKMKEYVSTVRRRFLNIMDSYWIDHIDALNSLKLSCMINPNGDPFKDFEMSANNRFFKDVIPAIYNEMLGYAFDPKMKFGEYTINYPRSVVEENGVVL